MATWKCPLLHQSYSWRTSLDTYLSLRKCQLHSDDVNAWNWGFLTNSRKWQQVVDLYLTQCLFITHLKCLITFSQCFHHTWGFDPKPYYTLRSPQICLWGMEIVWEALGWHFKNDAAISNRAVEMREGSIQPHSHSVCVDVWLEPHPG